MIKVGVVGCTGRLGSMIMNAILGNNETELTYAIGRSGNPYIGQDISSIIRGQLRNITITDSILEADNCEVLIDCTLAGNFINTNLRQYQMIGKPLIIGTTGFTEEEEVQIKELATIIPILKTGNFSITLHAFIETLKFAARIVSDDTDVQIIEYHHKLKKDSPSETAKMIRDAMLQANSRLKKETVNILSVRGGTMSGEHHVLFANCKDEVTEYIHKVSSRAAFSHGAVEAVNWIMKQPKGLYSMYDLIYGNYNQGEVR